MRHELNIRDITNFERKMNDKYHENGIIMITIKNRNEHI
jgi:hypothetical protein